MKTWSSQYILGMAMFGFGMGALVGWTAAPIVLGLVLACGGVVQFILEKTEKIVERRTATLSPEQSQGEAS